MASDEFGDKTHEATPYRRQRAREEGQVVRSQDLASALLLTAAVGLLWLTSGRMARFFHELVDEHLAQEAWRTLQPQDVAHLAVRLSGRLVLACGPLLGLLALAGALAHLVQFGFLYLPQKLAFDWQRISPMANGQRLFSLHNLVHLVFGILKTALILAVGLVSLWKAWDTVVTLPGRPVAQIGGLLMGLLAGIGLKVAAALLVLAIADYGYQYWKHEQDLRMTTQELKEEIKQQQGDPQIAARRKQIQRQMVLHRLRSTIPKADVVVTNPTELAVALRYDPETMAAPTVVAKGAGLLAQRIRKLALEHQVPVVERKELARALYATVEVGQQVPAEQYAAVAEVIRYVYLLKKKPLPVLKAA